MKPPQAYCRASSALSSPVADGAVLQGGGVAVKPNDIGNDLLRVAAAARRSATSPSPLKSTATPPGTIRSIISRWPKQAATALKMRSRMTPQCACMSEKEASLQIAPMSPK